MKAIQFDRYGGPEVLRVSDGLEKPRLNPGQVLVEIHVSGLNAIDWKIRMGYFKSLTTLRFPVTAGSDVSGVVTDLGEGVQRFAVGDEVFGSAIVLGGGSGALAEFAAVNADNIAHKPEALPFTDAGAMPLVGVSALQALEDHIRLRNGQNILIHGGAGGIGHIAIQLAKYKGATVATTVRGEDTAFAKQLGADTVIDYQTQQFQTMLTGFDAVFDTVGGAVTDASFSVLKKGGILVSMLGKPDERKASEYGVETIGQHTKIDTQHLERLVNLWESQAFTVHVDTVYPLDRTAEAFTYLESSHPRGKVAVMIR